MLQDPGDLSGGEEPAELPGAAPGEVGGERLRGGRAPLLHRAGPAHLSPGEVAGHPWGHPAPPPRHLPRPRGVPRRGQQVSHRAPVGHRACVTVTGLVSPSQSDTHSCCCHRATCVTVTKLVSQSYLCHCHRDICVTVTPTRVTITEPLTAMGSVCSSHQVLSPLSNLCTQCCRAAESQPGLA